MITNCQHTSGEAVIEFRKVFKKSDPSTITGYQLVVRANCDICGIKFHFPHVPPGEGHDMPAVNPNATVLTLPIIPGPAMVITLDGPTKVPTEPCVPHNN
jgi:hypothetical protein